MDRYATASALATAVRAAVASPEDIAAVRPASRVHVAVNTSDPHAATIPSPLPSAGGRPARSAPPASSPPLRAPNRSGRPSVTWIAICVVAALAGITFGAWLSMHAGR
jgi:hypothetical protein